MDCPETPDLQRRVLERLLASATAKKTSIRLIDCVPAMGTTCPDFWPYQSTTYGAQRSTLVCGVCDGGKALNQSPREGDGHEKARSRQHRDFRANLERNTGFEPATFALATRCGRVSNYRRASPTVTNGGKSFGHRRARRGLATPSVPSGAQPSCSTGVPTWRATARRGAGRSAPWLDEGRGADGMQARRAYSHSRRPQRSPDPLRCDPRPNRPGRRSRPGSNSAKGVASVTPRSLWRRYRAEGLAIQQAPVREDGRTATVPCESIAASVQGQRRGLRNAAGLAVPPQVVMQQIAKTAATEGDPLIGRELGLVRT